jgi:DNA ligase D-like protein (predicted polymerase)
MVGFMAESGGVTLEVGGRPVVVTHPDRAVFPPHDDRPAITKLDLVRYYAGVADGALRGVAGRPMILKRFVKGIGEEAVFQKRAPKNRPDWVDVAELRYASGASAAEAVVHDAAGIAWAVNLGCVDLNPHAVRADDLEHPDELRIDLDPLPGVSWAQIIDVAAVVREVLEDHQLTPWPKTSGSKGFHIYARIVPNWPFTKVRLAAHTVAREVELRAPELATAQWWKQERHGVFVDFNQNAKDRTVAAAYSVRAVPQARVSTPLHWAEVPDCRPDDFTIATVPARLADIGDPWEPMDDHAGSLEALLRRAAELGPSPRPPRAGKPLIEVARTKTRDEAMAAVEAWRERHPEAAASLQPADILVDGMRGPSSLWYRIRINLEHVPTAQRPIQEQLIADYSPWESYSGRQVKRAPE